MRMKSLPRRKKHRQTRHQGRERSESSTAQSHSGNFQERSESTIQTIDSVVEKFSEPGTGACAAGLFAVDVVHCRVEPDSEGVGVEWPGGGGAEEERVREVQEEDVEEDEEEAEESYHVGGEPEGEVFDAEIPLLDIDVVLVFVACLFVYVFLPFLLGKGNGNVRNVEEYNSK